MFKSNKRSTTAQGFTLVEVIVAILVLVIGLVGIAFTMTKSMTSTNQTADMSLASTLASEKLEDLNRWPDTDPHVAVTNGNTAGSLASDVVQTVTVNGNSESVNYYDEVAFAPTGQVNSGNGVTGAFTETVKEVDASGNVTYTTTAHSPDGQITVTTSTTAPPNPLTFRRRWIIEKDTPVAGVERITVLVSSLDQSLKPPVSFQMSMVRP